MAKSREYWTIKKILADRGLELVDMTIWDIIDYLEMVDDPEYTIFQWIQDTLDNYPETFVNWSNMS